MNTVLEDAARMFMWQRLNIIKENRAAYCASLNLKPHELGPSREDYERAEESMSDKFKCATGTTTVTFGGYEYPFVPLTVPSPQVIDLYPIDQAPQQGKETMCFDCDCDSTTETFDINEKRFSRLHSRAYQLEEEKERELRHHFGLVNDVQPQTIEEALKRLEDGKYVISDDHKKKGVYYFFDRVEWRDPKVKKDTEGFDKAFKELNKAYTDLKDTITFSDTDEAFKALKAFEKKSFH